LLRELLLFAPETQSSSEQNLLASHQPMTEPLKRTPLHAKHLESNARMVPFGGWDMPVQYTGVIAEHTAVRERAGMFDVSHMGEFRLRGPGALEFLQFTTVNDVSKLKVGRAQYNMLPNAQGGLVDDIYVYRLGELEFLMVVNASNIDKDFAHLEALKSGFDLHLENESDRWALIAVQGPQSEAILAPHCTESLSSRRKNSVFDTTLCGFPVRMARTGYTGEDGFEVFCANVDAPDLWQHLLELGLTPCGLGARDTLRLEAGYPLYGHEWSDETSPLETPFRWAVKEYKEFVGRDAMIAKPKTRDLIGLRVPGRGIPREGYPVKHDGQVVGHCTSGTMSPTLKFGIALAYVDVTAKLEPGMPVMLEIRGSDVPAEVVEAVFVSRGSPGPGV
jgi:aminomethyltransferase